MTINEASKVFLGAQLVDAVYLGGTLVWEPGGFAPTDIADCKVWVDASQLALANGAAVSPWTDLSGSGNHGVMIGAPSPILKTGILNSKPVVHMKQSEGRYRWSSVGTSSVGWTILYVSCLREYPSPQSCRILSSIYPPSNMVFGWYGPSMDTAYNGTFINPGTPWLKDKWKLYSFDEAPGNTLRFFNDGVLLGSNTGGEYIQGGFALSGYDPTGVDQTCECEVAELIIYKRKISDAERVQVESYLRAKWLPPPAGPTSSLLVSYSPGTDRNDFTGEVGVRLGIGGSPFTISWIGARCNGYGGTRTVKIYEWFSDTVVATATIDYTGKTVGEYAWAVVTPVTLAASGYYAMLMAVTASDGMWWKNPGATTFTGIANVYDCYRMPGGALSTGSASSQFIGLDVGW